MKNLQFLNRASNDDLRLLSDIVVRDKEGNFRLTEDLSGTDVFRNNYPHNIKGMLPELINELRLFGGNSIANFFRGEGPEYSEILRDVADRNDVSYNRYATDEMVEQTVYTIYIS